MTNALMSFRGSSSSILGVDVYGKHCKDWWFKAFLLPIWQAGRRIERGLMWLRYRLVKRHRYHMIDTGLPPRYYDIDTLMLNGMFALLRRYVEVEHKGVDDLERWGNELLEGSSQGFMEEQCRRQGNKELEAAALYRWWTETLPALHARKDALLFALYGNRRMKFVEVENTGLSEISFEPFQGNEVKMEEEFRELDERIDREEQEMLHRLVDIRCSLWT